MTANQHDIDRILSTGGGVIGRRQHPQLADSLSYLVREGRLKPVLPGIYAEGSIAALPATRMRAVALWDPDAVLTGAAAARLTFWSNAPLRNVQVAVRQARVQQPGFELMRRIIPAELVIQSQGMSCTTPSLTALDLCVTLGGEAIDEALRSRMSTLPDLHEALRLTPGRRDNHERRRLLGDSRDNPWSFAERRTHCLFRAAGITGWVGNFPLPVYGAVYYVDIAFPEIKLAVEIDGRAFHSDAQAFERDRWRQNDLVLAGWRVLRFTASMIADQPHLVVAVVLAALPSHDRSGM